MDNGGFSSSGIKTGAGYAACPVSRHGEGRIRAMCFVRETGANLSAKTGKLAFMSANLSAKTGKLAFMGANFSAKTGKLAFTNPPTSVQKLENSPVYTKRVKITVRRTRPSQKSQL